MSNIFKPMLAASWDLSKPSAYENLRYPLLASPKLDGIRCAITLDGPLSRSLKPIPNQHVRDFLTHYKSELRHFDGELMVSGSFQDVTSAIMRSTGTPDFTFQVFDWFGDASAPYVDRLRIYSERIKRLGMPQVVAVPTVLCGNAEQLIATVEKWLDEGYEGGIVRDPSSTYKYGRSTVKEGGMVKIKPFEDAEATVIGFTEQEANLNEKTVNELGKGKRSSHQENKVGKDTLGSLVVSSEEFGLFNVGTGLDDTLRKHIWANKRSHLGKIVKFRFQRIGTKDKPRIPSFLGFRHKDDL